MAAETQAALVAWYIDQMAALREQVDAAQQQAYTASDQSDDAADAYVATMVPLMAGAQATAAQLTAAYLTYLLADLAGQAIGAVVPPVLDIARFTGAALRNGVAPEIVYRRPFQQVWTDLSRAAKRREIERTAVSTVQSPARPVAVPRPTPRSPARVDERTPGVAETDLLPVVDEDRPDEDEPRREPEPDTSRQDAINAGQRRSRTIALTDLQLAATHAAQDTLSSHQAVLGYRRVLTGAENCGMCVVAATRLYHTRNLMPMHPGCDCVVAPVMQGEDPGRTINNRMLGTDAVSSATNKHGVPIFDADQTLDLGDLLEDTHRAIEERFGQSFRDAKGIDYRKVITVRQHGEIGPVLTIARHRFTKRQIRERDLSA